VDGIAVVTAGAGAIGTDHQKHCKRQDTVPPVAQRGEDRPGRSARELP